MWEFIVEICGDIFNGEEKLAGFINAGLGFSEEKAHAISERIDQSCAFEDLKFREVLKKILLRSIEHGIFYELTRYADGKDGTHHRFLFVRGYQCWVSDREGIYMFHGRDPVNLQGNLAAFSTFCLISGGFNL